MKRWKRFFALFFAAALFLTFSLNNVCAAEKYDYTVTFYAGNQGAFASQSGLILESEAARVAMTDDKIVVTGLQAGDQVGLTAQASISLDASSKYYVQGIRLSGRDNDTVADSVFTVTGDVDYVAAYGIKGNQVAYTVNYVDESGNALAPSDVFYGNIGDKPVVAYKYIENYAPKYLGLTKTLSANEAENVFTFVYEKMPEPTINEVIIENENIIYVPGQNGNNDDDNRPGTQDGQQGNQPGGQDNETDEPGGPNGEDNPQGDNKDDVIIDLDEEEVPLGGPDGTIFDHIPMAVYVGLGIISVIALIVLFIMLKRTKMNGEA